LTIETALMTSSSFVTLLFTSRSFVLGCLCILLSHSLFAKEIVTIDTGTQDAYHLEVIQDLASSEPVFFNIINDKNSSSTEKLEAKTRLGSIYLINKDFRQAIKYLQEVDAASSSVSDKNRFVSSARYNLGMIYIHGKGVEIDFEKAYHYFSQAGLAGNTPAVEEVVVMCINGEVSSPVIHRFAEEVYESYISALDDLSKEMERSHLSLLAGCPSQAQFVDRVINHL